MNIGLIGFGSVGKAFIKLLLDKSEYLKKEYNLDISLNYVIKSNGGIYSSDGINIMELVEFVESSKGIENHKLWQNEINIDILIKNKDVDAIVELTSTNIENGEPGLSHIEKALENNINVITGNKGPILIKYKELYEKARINNVKLMIGCTTGGALPSIINGTYGLAGAQINSIEGVLNGTSNFILTEMAEKDICYDEALCRAQNLGIAETNPKLDVEGFDTASKIIILSNVLMGTHLKIEDIEIKGITDIKVEEILMTKKNNKKFKLIGKILKNNHKISGYVKPMVIDETHPLYNVDGKNKGVLYKTDTLGDISIIGGASGTINAAASILRDILIINGLK